MCHFHGFADVRPLADFCQDQMSRGFELSVIARLVQGECEGRHKMSKVQSKRLAALKTFALIIAIGVGHYLQTHPTQVAMVETPVLLTDQG